MFQLGETPIEGAIAWKACDFADPAPRSIRSEVMRGRGLTVLRGMSYVSAFVTD